MFPIVIERPLRGANGRNWPGFVILDPQCYFPAAVLAQEAREAMFKLNPINLIKTRLSKRHRRRLEIMGHAAEIAAEVLIYGRDEEKARNREIVTLQTGYGGLFANAHKDALTRLLIEARDDARRWVQKHRNELERWK